MDEPQKNAFRLKKLFSVFGLAATLFLTGCATNSTQTISNNDDSITTTPSERVAIKYSSKKNLNDLPPEVAAFLNEGRVDNQTIIKVTPTKIGNGQYNHAILNNAKATDVVSIDPTKFAPPIALPYYGTEETLEKPIDFVATAPAYFAAAQPPERTQPSQIASITKTYASVKTNTRKTAAVKRNTNVVRTAATKSRVKTTMVSNNSVKNSIKQSTQKGIIGKSKRTKR